MNRIKSDLGPNPIEIEVDTPGIYTFNGVNIRLKLGDILSLDWKNMTVVVNGEAHAMSDYTEDGDLK